ncbi:predicted protein [Uncinocarpus reesii 1704]|uniref:Uncharacterized protein n=1 Tax=Uncinocarpus reesii (strain UAMH 1704) TaxID=336963 RepID=C4JJD5_UNCRE|nr:uncharacterized protein UREG_01742 [Uncinocarpus reesii 1704]EEP76893.1 predicted protein [Uncinocarpus reesii 1704]
MTESKSRPPSILLEPPPKGVELEDPGAHESAAESDDEHFSDASEGRNHSGAGSPRIQIPSPREGESDHLNVPLSPGGSPIPRTVVEKVDLEDASYGEEPGTPAYEARKMDAVPDLVYKVGEWHPEFPESTSLNPSGSPTPISPPGTMLSRVDSLPERTTSPLSFTAHKRSPSDAQPDVVVDVSDPKGSPSLSGYSASPQELDQNVDPTNDPENNIAGDGNAPSFGDDFDDFEEGNESAEQDDFGDFDNEFQVASTDTVVDSGQGHNRYISMEEPFPTSASAPLDFGSFDSLSTFLDATSDHLDMLFPKSTNLPSAHPIDRIPDSSAIFNTERSLSLWSQLVAPPPLQPPNWTKSRIRRLFLVSLGVPVDLDEILPASKQKKLVLPSITTHDASGQSRSRPKKSQEGSDQTARSSTSTDAARSRSRNLPSRRRRQQAPPELDLSAVRRLCATTDAALDGLTDEEMQHHLKTLEEMTVRASEVLEYWLKKRDGQVGEKEAYNGVIENLVKHARQVRS